MSEDDVRDLLTRRARSGLRPWCRANAVSESHANEFLNGRRGPASDLLNALGLEYRIVRKRVRGDQALEDFR